jgi:predicted GH43/DUF377 family glycosyl hydrolase
MSASSLSLPISPPRKVTEQVEALPLERDRLMPFGYNPTVIDSAGSLLICYRYHHGSSLGTRLAACCVTEEGRVPHHWLVEREAFSVEDPRFFRRLGQVWVSWVEAFPPQQLGTVHFGTFNEGALVDWTRPAYGANDGYHIEKNWVWFEHDDHLYFIYQSFPSQLIVQWSGDKAVTHTTPGLCWSYGNIRGGTSPMPYEGKLLRFFHSTVWPGRYYVIGACLMNPDPPFAVVAISSQPILWGSDYDDVPGDYISFHHNRRVVIPGGAVARPWGWLLAVGVNDMAVEIVKVKPEMLNLVPAQA